MSDGRRILTLRGLEGFGDVESCPFDIFSFFASLTGPSMSKRPVCEAVNEDVYSSTSDGIAYNPWAYWPTYKVGLKRLQF